MSNEPESLESETIRESFWSIERKNRLSFSFYFSLFFILSLLLVCCYYICYKNNGFTLIAFIRVAKVFVSTGLFAFALTFLGFEIRNAIKYIKLEVEKRGRVRHKEGRQEVLDWLAENYPDISPPSHLSE